jgi:hypothetical protein
MRASLSLLASACVLLASGGAMGSPEPFALAGVSGQSKLDPPLSDCQLEYYTRCYAHHYDHVFCLYEAQQQICSK